MKSWIAIIAGGLQLLPYILPALVGVGCIGYVTVTWVMYFVFTEQYLVAVVISLSALLVSAFALVRIPFALFFFFGAAAILGSAFLTGAGSLVLP